MGHEQRPLYAVGIVVLVVGFAVGIGFTNLAFGHVVLGMALLTCLTVTLYLVARRDRSHHTDLHDDDCTLDVH